MKVLAYNQTIQEKIVVCRYIDGDINKLAIVFYPGYIRDKFEKYSTTVNGSIVKLSKIILEAYNDEREYVYVLPPFPNFLVKIQKELKDPEGNYFNWDIRLNTAVSPDIVLGWYGEYPLVPDKNPVHTEQAKKITTSVKKIYSGYSWRMDNEALQLIKDNLKTLPHNIVSEPPKLRKLMSNFPIPKSLIRRTPLTASDRLFVCAKLLMC